MPQPSIYTKLLESVLVRSDEAFLLPIILMTLMFLTYYRHCRYCHLGPNHQNNTDEAVSSTESVSEIVSISSSSFSVAEGGCSDDDDDDDDEILEAVSLLFRQEDDDDKSDEYNNEYLFMRRRDVGTLIARVIPKQFTGFDLKKPVGCRRGDHSRLLRLLLSTTSCCNRNFQNGGEGIISFDWRNLDKEWDDREEERMVALEVRLSLSPDSLRRSNKSRCEKLKKNDRNVIDMKLLRRASEPAGKTLRRLHLSISKRLGCDKSQGTNAYRRCNDNNKQNQKSYQTNQRVDTQRAAERLATEPSIWVRGGSSSPDGKRFCHEPQDAELPSSSSLPESLTSEIKNGCLWSELAGFEGSCLYLGIQPRSPLLPLEVDACPPTILRVKVFEGFRSRLYVGVPICVELSLLHATHMLVGWFIEDYDMENKRQQACVHSAWVPASEASSSYTPSENDIGKSISVLFVPKRPGHDGEGCEEAYKFHFPVETLPPMPIISPLRDSWTVNRKVSFQSNQNLRILTYNLLADWYAGRAIDASTREINSKGKASKRRQGFYSFCDANFLMRNRRFPMMIAEILSYQPDIVCLQEVDEGIFDSLLMPVLKARGFQGYYSSKAFLQSEGCAMFWSLQAFERAEEEDLNQFHLCNFFRCHGAASALPREEGQKEEGNQWAEGIASIQQLLKSNAAIREVMTSKVGQVLQVACLRPLHHRFGGANVPKEIVVGNTHLFYHPLADHIRAIQAYEVCGQLDAIRGNNHQAPIVLCGDLNSNPRSGAVQLLLQGQLEADHVEAWKNVNEYSWEMGGENYLFEHGYLGNDADVENNPSSVSQQCFEDALDEQPGLAGKKAAPTGLSLHLPSGFPRLITGYPNIPKFTNFSVGFAETLDYILVSTPSATTKFGFIPVDSAPTPTINDMNDYTAMPNEFMPSDHVSLVCDLAWA